MTSYQADLLVAWLLRGMFYIGVVAIIAILAGCGHTLNTSSTGTLTRDPPVSTQPTN